MKVDLFDFDLPEERIALRPAEPRDRAKLLVVRPGEGLVDKVVRDLPGLLQPGDALVFNDTKVIPAQLEGVRVREGAPAARIGATLHQRVAPERWRAFVRGARKLKTGDHLQFGGVGETCMTGTLNGKVAVMGEAGEVEIAFDLAGGALDDALAAVGHVPLPPYIAQRRPDDARDRVDYQTIYAREEGAVAAPTAGLHFTPELFDALDRRGVERHFVTLHVGAGTFLPVKAEDTKDHKMHFETGTVSEKTAAALNRVPERGGRIVAVGTTSLRLLESAANTDGRLATYHGATDIFITPGYRFRFTDMLMTNFHLPRSTLMMLVAAFCGLETIQQAYRHAIEHGYRFYSYGDACLLHGRS